MTKYIFILVVFLFFYESRGQTDPTHSFDLILGYGTHGSGDLKGYQYGFQYAKEISKRWRWALEFSGSLHDGADDKLIFQDELGNDVDATLHFVIGGIQTGFGLGYSFVKSHKHGLAVTVLPIVRYQATSISDLIVTLSPGATDLPFPVRNLVRFEPARTLSLGSVFRLKYLYSMKNKYTIGLGVTFQTDTNEDSIVGTMISVGKRF